MKANPLNFQLTSRNISEQKNIGQDSSSLIHHFYLALGTAGVADENRMFKNVVSTVLDGREQFKVEFS